jgi:hypothetical protein
MDLGWDDSRRAFTDAAMWFVDTVALVGDRWNEPGLGVWDIRALVGHTSRSLLTVESYLARPAAAVQIPSAADYFRATPPPTRLSPFAGATPAPLWATIPQLPWPR